MKKFSKIRPIYLLLAVVIVVLGFGFVLLSAQVEAKSYADMQLRAAERMEKAEAYLKERIISLGIENEPEDINQTYLLGPEWSELTSTPGEEGAKRSALNPEFAAAMVRYYHDAGLEKGDSIAIGTSGSFPGFVIATLCAATEMELDTRIIASLGASMHGGTRVDFNVFDIMSTMKEGGFVDYNLLAVSCGSANDAGGSVLEEILYEGTAQLSEEICRREAERTGAEFIHYPYLGDSINRRFELYGKDVKLFVNIGGASVNSGDSAYTLDFPQGLVLDPPKIPDVPLRGLNYEYAAIGTPVLNLLNVKLLCQENSIPFDPVPLSHAGETAVYSEVEYNRPLIIGVLVLLALDLIIGSVDAILQKKKKESSSLD
ncbi:MAG: poly-gamma-glutamate system protein [Spirochaetales bacterium]|nr:poly-gamma-glutamate system protein [Candidatus Physcosoma equi]